jgi:hypothetical protein
MGGSISYLRIQVLLRFQGLWDLLEQKSAASYFRNIIVRTS